MIKKLIIKNYKIFSDFELELNEDLNIIVGDNEAGKSTILEAINLALSQRLNGHHISTELSSFLINKEAVDNYLAELKADKNPTPPDMFIELYLSNEDAFADLQGTNNSLNENAAGIRLELLFDQDYAPEYKEFINDKDEVTTVPTEYYKVNWFSFAGNAITSRSLSIKTSLIDATTIRLQSGTDFYMQNIINSGLHSKEKVALSLVYRSLRETFMQHPSIDAINAKLVERQGVITDKDLALSLDTSHKSNWETNLIPYLDELPFHLVGKGEQNSLKILLALDREDDDAHVILIEEPENHLSFSSMNKLVSKIRDKCEGKQLIITTHSAYVLNKLGLEKLILLYGNNKAKLSNLPEDTQNYFKKLSGYDTLRLVLAKKAVLVEGPSDELIFQKAYMAKHSHRAIEDEIDVISASGLSFSRFLDIAKDLSKEIIVVTDNDGDFSKNVSEKYASYSDTENIQICSSEDNNLPTLEPHLVGLNELEKLNSILGKTYADKEQLLKYMTANKTEYALNIFESDEEIIYPEYILNAVQ